MQHTINFLTQAKEFIKVGERKAKYSFWIGILDRRTQSLLSELNYEPSKNKVQMLWGTADERKAELDAELKAAEKYPAVMMPLALDTIMQDISDHVRKDLLLSVFDFSYKDYLLRFRISTSSFAMSFSDLNRVSEEKRIGIRLEKMRREGYIIEEKRHGNPCLKDCPKNRTLLEQYLEEQFGAFVVRIDFYRGAIDSLECRLRLDKCPFDVKKRKMGREIATDVLTEDEVTALQRVIDKYISAICMYSSVDDKNLILGCFRSYMYEIENILNYKGSIWNEMENEYREERGKNHEMRRIKEEKGRSYVKKLSHSFGKCYDSVLKAVSYHAMQVGFSVRNLSFKQYEAISFELKPAGLYSEPTFLVSLEGKADLENDRIFKMWDTPENMSKIEKYLRKFLPKMEISEYTVQNDQEKYIKSIFVNICPTDLANLLESVSEVDEAVMEDSIF